MGAGVADILLWASVALAAIYGAVFCYRRASLPKASIKTLATAGLGLWAWMAGGPVLLVAALGLSAVGDAFLAGDDERWLPPGMAAFFAAHIAYVALFWNLGADQVSPEMASAMRYGGPFALAVLGAAYLRWLLPDLGKLRWPVLAYGIVIVAMGILALRLLPDGRWIAGGALMFILSDAILANELFKRPAEAAARVLPSVALWALYFGGQALIAWGVIGLGA